MNSLTDGVSRIGPHPASHTEAEMRAARSMRKRAAALVDVTVEICGCHDCDLRRSLAAEIRALPLFEDKP